jgi:hypothetical protein
MLRLLQSLFGGGDKPGSYPESLVKTAIERAVDGTDPWLRGVTGYRKKLRQPVVRAIDHVVALVDGLAPPLTLAPESFGNDPRLPVFFLSGDHLRDFVQRDPTLAEFRRGTGNGPYRTVALLAMEKREKAFFGAALSGEILQRDVLQTAVGFEAHRLIDPAATEEQCRRQLKRRAFDHLLGLALGRITGVKRERQQLERYRALLQAKVDLLHRGGWGFNLGETPEAPDVAAVEEQLCRIESQMLELGRDDRILEVYLEIATEVLGKPEAQLWMKQERLVVDQMGIKRREAVGDAREIRFDMLHNAEGRSLVLSLVELLPVRH